MPRSRRIREADRSAGLSLRQGLALAVALLLGAPLWFGVPSAAVTPKKDASRPFPCQNRPCGCMTAEACWKQCCCFSKREKLEWARRNGVAPPPEAELGLTDEPSDALCSTGEDEPAACPFCKAAEQSEAAAAAKADTAPSTWGSILAWAESWPRSSEGRCCAPPRKPAAAEEAQAEVVDAEVVEAETAPRGWVPMWDVLRCRGLGGSWMGPPWALAPPPPALFLEGRVAERMAVFSAAASMHRLPPPSPPPKRSSLLSAAA